MRVLSGIQPTGRFHWGNYFGAIRQYIALQDHEKTQQAFYFIADLHALTTVRDKGVLEEYVNDAALDLLALGVDPDKASLFRQSDVPEIPELYWVLLALTPMGLLQRGVAYKEKIEAGLPADAGLFAYPVLQAADILLYDSDTVPVGRDQVQNLEICRDLAQRFNNTYEGEYLPMPEPFVVQGADWVPGTDGQKMSKSYGNTIEIFEAAKSAGKKIRSIKTDSKTVEDPKDPETDCIFALYTLFATQEEQDDLAARYRAGGMGYGEAKKLLEAAAMERFAEAREQRERLQSDPDTVRDILREGASKAREKGREVLDRVRKACGLGSRIE